MIGGEHQEHEPEETDDSTIRLNLTRAEAQWLRDVVVRVKVRKKRTEYMRDQIAYGLTEALDRNEP